MSVSIIHKSKASATTYVYKTSLILLPLVSTVNAISPASAEVLAGNEDVGTSISVNEEGNQFDITDGTVGGSNLFHDFEQFDVNADQTVNFITVPDIQNVVSTVSSHQASVIDGTLQVSGSNANLYLMNPAGILLGPNIQLNLPGSFSATTATGLEFGEEQLTGNSSNNYAALTGDVSAFRFDSQQTGAVVNLGDLNVGDGQSITLIGSTVVNTGNLRAPEGSITLAAIEDGNTVRIQQEKQLLSLEVEATDAMLLGKEIITPTSLGEMLVGGNLNHGTQLVTNADGTVHITGNEHPISAGRGETITSGLLSTTGDFGGNINVLGENVAVREAVLDASGTQGGGLIRVGGDYKGEGNINNALQTLVDKDSSLIADAIAGGDGGSIIVWADETTRYDGHLSARGGRNGGDGGFVEVSGKEELSFTGSIDLRAESGETGTVLFDPTNITITDDTPILGDNNLFLSSSTIEELSVFSNIVLEASNDIVIDPIPDGALSLAEGKSITLIADSNNVSGGEFRMHSNDVIEVDRGNIEIFGAGITAGKLTIDSQYDNNEANDSSIGNIRLDSSEWLTASEIISERGNVTLSANGNIDIGIINTSSDDRNHGGETVDGRTRIAAGDIVLNSNLSVTVGEILTYGSFDGEQHSPDGGNVTIEAEGGDIVIERTIETFSEVQGRESGSAGNITLTAQNNIFINTEGVLGPSLNASSTAKTYDTGNGGDISLNAEQGLIDIIGNIDTSSEARNGNGDSSSSAAVNGGNVELLANGDIKTDSILSRAIANIDNNNQNGDNAGRGGDIVIYTAYGNAQIGSIEAYSSADRNNARGGGSVEILAANDVYVRGIDTSTRANTQTSNSGDINITAQNSVVVDGELESYSYARAGSGSSRGGDISIVGNRITTELIEAWSAARESDSGKAGNVSLIQHSEGNDNFVFVDGSIQTYSSARQNNAGNGGNVLIDMGRAVEADLNSSIIITGHIDTSSHAGNNISGNSGNIESYADSISITDVDTQSHSNNAGNAGSVTLEGDRSISVGSILATSTDNTSGEILLSGDSITLTGDRVAGELVRFSPFTASQDINIGFDGAGNALNIDASALNKIENRIEFGNLDRSGTGTISLAESSLTTAENIDVLGGDRLIGPNVSTRELTYILQGDGDGSIAETNIQFFDIENIEGGTGNDVFKPSAGVSIDDLNSLSGGDGFNTLNYENFSTSPLTVDLKNLAINRIQRIVGSESTENTLQGENRNNQWQISGQGQGSLNGLLTFDKFSNIVGGNGIDTLDYSSYVSDVAVDLDGTSTGLNSFSSIERIFGSVSNADRLIGSDENDTFVLGNDTRVNGIEISSFEIFDGDEGDNTFHVEQITPEISIVGGSNAGGGKSNNRLIFNGETSTWNITGVDQGTLEQTGNILNFREIQHIENNAEDSSTSAGEVEILFSQANSQITGSISSGDSNLTLIGNDINIGHGNGAGDNQNGAVSGSGRLNIRPQTEGVALEIGGNDQFSPEKLNITDGELAALQDGFIEIIFGDSEITSEISLGGDVQFQDSVSLVSQGSIDTTGRRVLISEGDLTLSTDSSLFGDLVESRGGNIQASAQESIQLGDVSTIGDSGSGSIELTAANGTITTGNLVTSVTTAGGRAGRVTLSSPGSIEINSIEAEGAGKDNTTRRIDISTSDTFTATGSISTAGAESDQGSIRITFGNEDADAEAFTVGERNARNSTAGTITTGQTLLDSGKFIGSYSQANIELINRGLAVPTPPTDLIPEDREMEAPQMAPAPAPTENFVDLEQPTTVEQHQLLALSASLDLPEVVDLPTTSNAEEEKIFDVVENSIGQEFSHYFSRNETSSLNATSTLGQAQDKLKEVAQTSGVIPALVYVYFMPDAASETAVLSEKREASHDDQLEIMLITQEGQPTRHRQWGITREQVDETTQNLRRQTTSQFSAKQQYLQPAQQLYDWIMSPIEEALEQERVESLGFVMDTGLRTMPIAALHDGDRYLVENYSLGILPTFSLTNFDNQREQVRDFRDASVLAMGASEFEDQPDLPAVDKEVSLITEQLWEGDAFLNEDFILKNLQSQIQAEDYGIVHLATHANFEADDLDSSYIQMWDERLALSDVSQLGLSNAEIGLIILSACNTAIGDHNSEYGFAGFAVNAGSSSALASLWPVNDEGTLGFMSQFYAGLQQSPVRSEALRQAQITLISGEVGIDYGNIYGPNGESIVTIPELSESGQWDFSHPFYWSAFTMIGNPW
ncbi:MAG: CHAT domain-containing protein [Phormidesmis sp.]